MTCLIKLFPDIYCEKSELEFHHCYVLLLVRFVCLFVLFVCLFFLGFFVVFFFQKRLNEICRRKIQQKSPNRKRTEEKNGVALDLDYRSKL